MADYGDLFLLILVALTFVIVGMLFVVYLMILGEREKNRLRANLNYVASVEGTILCQHSFGYLAGHPPNEPVPDECFGCPKAVDCMNGHTTTVKSAPKAKRPPRRSARKALTPVQR